MLIQNKTKEKQVLITYVRNKYENHPYYLLLSLMVSVSYFKHNCNKKGIYLEQYCNYHYDYLNIINTNNTQWYRLSYREL